MSSPSTRPGTGRDRWLRVAAVVFGVVVLLWSVLVAQQILAVLVLFGGAFVVYLLWRFVRAHERLADATERMADARAPEGSRSPREEGVDEGEDPVREREGERE